MKIMGSIRLQPSINEMLRDISTKRKANGEIIKTQQDIVADLIIKAHKREIKQ